MEMRNEWGDNSSYPNLIEPKKRPLSSMSPAFLMGRDGNVVTTIGGAGGPSILSAVSFVSYRTLSRSGQGLTSHI